MKAGWEVKALGEICEIAPKKSLAKKTLDDAQRVSFVPMDHLGELTRDFKPKDERKLANVYKGYTYFADGDVIIAKITPCFENGKMGVAKGMTNGVGFGSSEFVPIRGRGKTIPEYLFYYLLRDDFREAGARVMSGAVGHKRVPKEYFATLPIPLPPLDEQKQIVAVLDAAFEGLTRARTHVETNLQNARELFESTLDELIWTNASVWKKAKIKEIVGNVATGPFGSLLHKSDYVEGARPIVNPAHLIDGKIVADCRKTISVEKASMLKSYVLRTGDIVFGRRGDMGRCAVVETPQDGWLCGTGSFFIRPKESVSPEFVAHVLRSPTYVRVLEEAATGATMLNISNKTLANLEIPLPQYDDQISMLGKIDYLRDSITSISDLLNAKLQDLDDLRQSLLKKAFAGEFT